MISSDDLRGVAQVMQDFGLTYLKTTELELTRAEQSQKMLIPASHVPTIPVDAPSPESEPIENKTVEMPSLLKLSDLDLVDRLFPDHTGIEEEAS